MENLWEQRRRMSLPSSIMDTTWPMPGAGYRTIASSIVVYCWISGLDKLRMTTLYHLNDNARSETHIIQPISYIKRRAHIWFSRARVACQLLH